MVFYIMLAAYALASLLNFKVSTRKGRQFSIFILLLPMFLFVAFRDASIGPDTEGYYRIFNGIVAMENISFFELITSSRLEPGYLLINYIFARLGCSYYTMQLFFSSFIFLEIGKFINRYSVKPAFSCFVFYATRAMFGTMNVVRMWVAAVVLLSTIPYIREKKWVHFLILVALAGTFHYSALLFLIVYPMSRIKLNGKTVFIIFTFCVLIWQTAVPVFTYLTRQINLYGNYITSSRFTSTISLATGLGLLINLIFFALFFFMRQTPAFQSNGDVEDVFHRDFYYLMMVLTVAVGIIGLSNNIMGRLSHYFSLFLIVGIPDILYRIRNFNNKRILTRAVIAGLAMDYIVVMTLRPEWYMVLPYKFFF